jgi:DNA-binding protein WhiA
MAWLRGTFLARGSLSLRGGTHLELVVGPEDAQPLAARLADVGLPATWRIRRGRGVVTWKGREPILTFLRRAGASAAALELESRSVTQTLRGQLNRVLNAESANLRRSVAASSRQIAAIELLDRRGELERLPPFHRSVARLRRAEPGHTLTDLALRLGVGRGRVQRALEHVEAVAERAGAGVDMG